eukprot:scaffold257301_cov24-Tisochrysis_lutea.AAC.2
MFAHTCALRSLDWCCQVELLLLVGAPQQAFERISANFFSFIEWFEANVLGWDIPGEEESMPMFQNIALYYPEEHAYTFDQYSIGADTSVQAMAREALSHCGAGQALGSPPHRVFVMASMYLRTSSNLQRRHQIGAQEEARCVGKCGNRGLAVWDYEVPEEAYGVC